MLAVNKITRPDNTELISGLDLLAKKAGFQIPPSFM